ALSDFPVLFEGAQEGAVRVRDPDGAHVARRVAPVVVECREGEDGPAGWGRARIDVGRRGVPTVAAAPRRGAPAETAAGFFRCAARSATRQEKKWERAREGGSNAAAAT